MIVLSLDPAKKTGWCVSSVEDGVWEIVDSGTFTWHPSACDSVLESLGDFNPTHLSIEDAFERASGHRNRLHAAQAQRRIGYIAGFMRSLLADSGDGRLPIWIPLPSQWRKLTAKAGYRVCQQPRAQAKLDALKHARNLGRRCLGTRGGDADDEADAIMQGLAASIHFAKKEKQTINTFRGYCGRD